jgi:hypothetical protein
MRLTEAELEQLLRDGHAKIHRDSAVCPADLEPGSFDEPEEADAAQAFDAPVVIRIHSRRHRLADSDGLCGKWTIDSIVAAGILRDDSARWVKEVRFSQEKIPAVEPETTEIDIREANSKDIVP